MKLQGLKTSMTAALLIGTLQAYLLILCWVYIARYTLLPRWLIGQGVSSTAFRIVLLRAATQPGAWRQAPTT